jgi:hypothetical protein
MPRVRGFARRATKKLSANEALPRATQKTLGKDKTLGKVVASLLRAN